VAIVSATDANTQRNNSDNSRATAQAEAGRANTAQAESNSQRINADNAKATAEAEAGRANTAQAQAEQQRKAAEAQALAFKSQLLPDPELGLLLAREAAQRVQNDKLEDKNNQVENSLRHALRDSHLRLVLGDRNTPDVPLQGAEYSPDGKYILTYNNLKGVLWDASSGKMLAEIPDLSINSNSQKVSASFSPDGQRILITGSGKILLVDGTTGKLISELAVKDPSTASFKTIGSFSPDSQTVFAAIYIYNTQNFSNEIRAWKTNTGKLISTFGTPSHNVNTFAFSPDNKYLVTGSSDWTARVWELATGKQIALLGSDGVHVGEVSSVAFSHDGKKVITAGDTTGKARVFDIASAKLLFEFESQGAKITKAVFSQDDEFAFTTDDSKAYLWSLLPLPPTLISSSRSNTAPNLIKTWDLNSKKELGINDPYFYICHCVVNKLGNTLKLYDYSSRKLKEIAVLPVEGLSPDDKLYAKAGDLNNALIYEAEEGSEVANLRGHTGAVVTVRFNPRGEQLLTASKDSTARVWQITKVTSSSFQSEVKTKDTILVGKTATFSIESKRIALVKADNIIELLDNTTGKIIKVLSGHSDRILGVRFSQDGKYLVSGSADKTARLWDATNGDLIKVFSEARTIAVLDVRLSPDDKFLLTFSEDSIYHGSSTNRLHSVWEVSTGRVLQRFETNNFDSPAMGISPDNQYAFTAGYGGSYGQFRGLLLKVSDGTMKEFQGQSNGAFTADGKYLVTGSANSFSAADGKYHIINGIKLFSLNNKNDSEKAISSFLLNGTIFSSDGQFFITGTPENTATIWKFPNLELVSVLRGHSADIKAAAWSKDGKFIVTTDEKGTGRIWEVATGTTLTILRGLPEIVSEVSFSPDNKKIFVASNDTVQMYDCEICGSMPELIALAGKQVTRELTTPERQQYLGEK